MNYYVVDAFTETAFGGNPAGVVVYESLDAAFMQKFAAEVRFSETAFIRPLEEGRFEIRFFTPTDEVDLCGHATIASFQALMDLGLVSSNGTYRMETKAGSLPIEIRDSFIMMEQAKPQFGKQYQSQGELEELAELFCIPVSWIGDDKHPLYPQAASTGLWEVFLPLRSEEALLALDPDFPKIAAYSAREKVGGIHAFALQNSEVLASCRNFGPLLGIDEEAATGTSNGALTGYLYVHHVISEFDRSYQLLQGKSMKRPSIITTKLIRREDPRVMVGGKAVILSRGELAAL